MPRKPSEEAIVEQPVEKLVEAVETLVPFNVVIDGKDRTIFAKDEQDLQRRIAKLR